MGKFISFISLISSRLDNQRKTKKIEQMSEGKSQLIWKIFQLWIFPLLI